MPTGNLKLTSLDKKILHSYCQTLDGLSNYLGNGYEIVLHSLEDYEHSAIKVINGYHTGRTEGAPITDLALKMLEQIRRNEENDHGVIYFSTNSKGRTAEVNYNSCQRREGQNYRTALYQLLYEYNNGRFLLQLCCSDSI